MPISLARKVEGTLKVEPNIELFKQFDQMNKICKFFYSRPSLEQKSQPRVKKVK